MKSSVRRFGLAVLLFSLAGCGLQGPLYLPDDQQQEAPAETPKPVFEGSKVRTLPPAPQAQKKDRERSRTESSTSDPQSQPTPVSPPDPDRPVTPPPPPKAGQ